MLGVSDLVGVRGRPAGRNEHRLTDGGRPMALPRGGGEQGPWGGVVGWGASGRGAAGGGRR